MIEGFEMSETMRRRLLAQPLNPLRKMKISVMRSQAKNGLNSSVESDREAKPTVEQLSAVSDGI